MNEKTFEILCVTFKKSSTRDYCFHQKYFQNTEGTISTVCVIDDDGRYQSGEVILFDDQILHVVESDDGRPIRYGLNGKAKVYTVYCPDPDWDFMELYTTEGVETDSDLQELYALAKREIQNNRDYYRRYNKSLKGFILRRSLRLRLEHFK